MRISLQIAQEAMKNSIAAIYRNADLKRKIPSTHKCIQIYKMDGLESSELENLCSVPQLT